MNIEFPGPSVPAEDGGISFKSVVNGETVACKFSMEVLQDVDPNLTMESPTQQFESSKSTLLQIAEKKIRDGKVDNGVIRIFTADL